MSPPLSTHKFCPAIIDYALQTFAKLLFWRFLYFLKSAMFFFGIALMTHNTHRFMTRTPNMRDRMDSSPTHLYGHLIVETKTLNYNYYFQNVSN